MNRTHSLVIINTLLKLYTVFNWKEKEKNVIKKTRKEESDFSFLRYRSTSTSYKAFFFNSYLRSETNSCFMFISSQVNWTWWRRASFYLKAFPVLIKQSNWFLYALDLYLSLFFFLSIVLIIVVNLIFFPRTTNHIHLYVFLFYFIISWTNKIKEIMKKPRAYHTVIN
jgi:hypothetical protein